MVSLSVASSGDTGADTCYVCGRSERLAAVRRKRIRPHFLFDSAPCRLPPEEPFKLLELILSQAPLESVREFLTGQEIAFSVVIATIRMVVW